MHLQRDRMLRKVGTQVVKWTTEGAVKEDTQILRPQVFCDVRAYVSCRGYVGIL